MVKITFLAKGTRGDVEPLLALCLAITESVEGAIVTLACCPSALDGLKELVNSNTLIHHALPESRQRLLDAKDQGDVDGVKQELLVEEVLSAITACHNADLIVFNLFTCEGYYIAQSMGVACIAVSPFIITRPPPTGFEKRFAAACPDLYRRLKDTSSTATVGRDELSYSEVDHWMWRLFLSDLTSACTAAGLPADHTKVSSIPLLYGVSDCVLPRQPYWPSSVNLCGYWQLQQQWLPALSDDLLVMVTRTPGSPVLYVGFGSMEHYLSTEQWLHAITIIDKVCGSLSVFGLLQCHHGGHLYTAYHQQQHWANLQLWCHPAPHARLFPLCSAILHHGGWGTAAAALMAGVPQMVCPVMFDQHHTAEQLEWRSVARVCDGPSRITPHQLTLAMQAVLSDTMRAQAMSLSKQLHKENSLSSTLAIIMSRLN